MVSLHGFLSSLALFFSCLLLGGVIRYSVKPITSSQLSCFEIFWALTNTSIMLRWFWKISSRFLSTYIEGILKELLAWSVFIHHIHCLDKLLHEAIFQAEICLLELRQQLKWKSTFLLSHRHSDFHVFDEVLFLTTRKSSRHFQQL